jgi:hypothetical protein
MRHGGADIVMLCEQLEQFKPGEINVVIIARRDVSS